MIPIHWSLFELALGQGVAWRLAFYNGSRLRSTFMLPIVHICRHEKYTNEHEEA